MKNTTLFPILSYDDGGDFEFTVIGGGELPVNGECSGAITIESGVTVEGSTPFGFIPSEDTCEM